MASKRIRFMKVASAATLALSVLALGCGLPSVGPGATDESSGAPTEAPTATLAAATPGPTDAPAPTGEATAPAPTLAPPPTAADAVVLTATGNVFIRRGPGLAYNTLSYMPSGQSVPAQARNSAADWLYVERPDTPGSFGWIFLGTYVDVDGDPQSLEVRTADPAAPAYLRNCTFHPMRIMPGNFILAEQFDPSNNIHQVNPGSYEAYDQNVEGDPMVLNPTVREGQTIDITTDGLHNTYACPG
jgi:hypothetical protein